MRKKSLHPAFLLVTTVFFKTLRKNYKLMRKKEKYFEK
jgi:hypothetical protein